MKKLLLVTLLFFIWIAQSFASDMTDMAWSFWSGAIADAQALQSSSIWQIIFYILWFSLLVVVISWVVGLINNSKR
jgi:ABC-type spermidine/putrescine transport system permease subunit I